MRDCADRRGWRVAAEIREIGSGALQRPKREELLAAVRRREVDVVVVWRLDRWAGRLPTLHPGGTGALKKNGPQAIGKSRGGWTTKIHMVAADARTAITFALTAGRPSDARAGRELLGGIGRCPPPCT